MSREGHVEDFLQRTCGGLLVWRISLLLFYGDGYGGFESVD